MKPKLHTLLILTAAIGASPIVAQDNPPPPPPRPDAPAHPPEPRRRDAEPRRPGEERTGGDSARRRPNGERPPGGETRRGPGPSENSRRDSEPRNESGSRFSPPMHAAPQRLRPYLGVVTSAAPPAVAAQAGLPEGFGLVVDEVLPDSPAKAAGLERYDVLTKFDDQKLVGPEQLAALVGATKKDAEVAVTLLRRGQEQKVTVKVAEKMLPDRQAAPTRSPFGDLREMWQRYGAEGAPLRERAEDAGRRAQEIGREFQRRMREFQEKVEQWRKNPQEKFPEPPKFPSLDPAPPSGNRLGERHPDRLPSGDSRGPAHPERHTTTTIRNTAQANISIKDDDGEIEVRSEDGRRTLVAKDKSGATIFNGAIDTEDQRRALPENVRRKLDRVEVRTRVEHSEPPRDTPPPRPGAVQ